MSAYLYICGPLTTNCPLIIITQVVVMAGVDPSMSDMCLPINSQHFLMINSGGFLADSGINGSNGAPRCTGNLSSLIFL
jgi:hypothetical protein